MIFSCFIVQGGGVNCRYLSAGRDKAVEEETEPDDTEEDEEEDDEDEEDDDISTIGDDGIKDGKVDDSFFI